LPKTKKKLKPMTKCAYVDITPTVNFRVRGLDANSATVVRQLFIDGNDSDRDQIITDLYGAPDSSLRDMFKQRLGITDQVVQMMQECRRIGTAQSLALMERVMRDERVALNEFVPDSKYFGNNPDGFPRRPQKFKKGDVVWVADQSTDSTRNHFPGNCPAIVLYSYESEYGDSEGYVYVNADPDDPDLQEYIDDAWREANREHDYGLFILAKGDIGQSAWYPEGILTLIPRGTDPVALCSRGNAAPYATLPARAKKLLSQSLGTTLKEFAPNPDFNDDNDNEKEYPTTLKNKNGQYVGATIQLTTGEWAWQYYKLDRRPWGPFYSFDILGHNFATEREAYASLKAYHATYTARQLREFAPAEPGGNDDGDVPPDIYKLANRWWNASDDEDQDRIAMTLRSQGWDICQADGEEDVCQLTYQDGTVHYLNDGEFDPDLYENSDYIEEKWSTKYKRSINCANPRGFSQKAHCAGRKK
jgi:hypothetical protein